jgi:hypothetical protein
LLDIGNPKNPKFDSPYCLGLVGSLAGGLLGAKGTMAANALGKPHSQSRKIMTLFWVC